MPKIAVTQLECAVGNIDANLAKAEDLIAAAAAQNADLVLLPELFTTGFPGDALRTLCEPIPGPTTERFAQIASAHQIHIVAGMAEIDPETDNLHNAAVIIAPDGHLIRRYRKVYLYMRERQPMTPGTEACLIDFPFGRAGVSICYDYIFAHYIHGLVERGAELLLHPTAWVTTDTCEQWHYSPQAYRARCMTRALENSVYFASSNLIGPCDPDGHVRAIGQSSIIAPWGEILAEVPTREGVAIADIDFSLSPQWRRDAAPYIEDWHRTIEWPDPATATGE